MKLIKPMMIDGLPSGYHAIVDENEKILRICKHPEEVVLDNEFKFLEFTDKLNASEANIYTYRPLSSYETSTDFIGILTNDLEHEIPFIRTRNTSPDASADPRYINISVVPGLAYIHRLYSKTPADIFPILTLTKMPEEIRVFKEGTIFPYISYAGVYAIDEGLFWSTDQRTWHIMARDKYNVPGDRLRHHLRNLNRPPYSTTDFSDPLKCEFLTYIYNEMYFKDMSHRINTGHLGVVSPRRFNPLSQHNCIKNEEGRKIRMDADHKYNYLQTQLRTDVSYPFILSLSLGNWWGQRLEERLTKRTLQAACKLSLV